MRRALFLLATIAPLSPAQVGPVAAPGGPREEAAIDWNAYQSALEKAKPRADRTRAGGFGNAIKETRLPVLLATHDDVRAGPDFRTQGTSYVAHYQPDATIDIAVFGSASRLAAGANGSGNGAATSKPAEDNFEVLEDVTDLSFSRFGASYTIRASCKDPQDARCKQPAYLTAFKNSLVPVAR